MTLSTHNVHYLIMIMSIDLMIIINRNLTQIACTTLSMIIHPETKYLIGLSQTSRMMKSTTYFLHYFLINLHPLTIFIKVDINLIFLVIYLI